MCCMYSKNSYMLTKPSSLAFTSVSCSACWFRTFFICRMSSRTREKLSSSAVFRLAAFALWGFSASGKGFSVEGVSASAITVHRADVVLNLWTTAGNRSGRIAEDFRDSGDAARKSCGSAAAKKGCSSARPPHKLYISTCGCMPDGSAVEGDGLCGPGAACRARTAHPHHCRRCLRPLSAPEGHPSPQGTARLYHRPALRHPSQRTAGRPYPRLGQLPQPLQGELRVL